MRIENYSSPSKILLKSVNSQNGKTKSHPQKANTFTNDESPALPDAAFLVLDDGCRNPVYSAVAPNHPSRDPSNPLLIRFNFKAFMFQDMTDGGTIRISAKIIACQDLSDCQPV